MTIPASVTSIGAKAFGSALKNITFLGSAPTFETNTNSDGTTAYTFSGVTATAHYPENNASWTAAVRNSAGGNITWLTEAGWKQNSTGWWYQRDDGTYPKDQWEKIDNKWYHFNASGYMQTGWLKLGNTWYYLGSAMVTGWQKINNVWYWFADNGAMQTGWQKLGNVWYYFASNGAMQTGWQKIGSSWYYFGSNGKMVTGWQVINGKSYFFKTSGAMAANEWCNGYWLNADGTFTYHYQASWHQNAKGWWYGDTSGWYAKNTTIVIDGKSYTFDANGYMK